MPAGWRAFPDAQDQTLFIHLLGVRFLARLLIGLLALTLLLVTVLLGLLRIAVLGIVHR